MLTINFVQLALNQFSATLSTLIEIALETIKVLMDYIIAKKL